ncbi:hypothetical protein BDR05DRAFT_969000 [Suillus weaverae]|nr:hypothetical protein BDR05DRAFT_969000 [Suillus weaverae]
MAAYLRRSDDPERSSTTSGVASTTEEGADCAGLVFSLDAGERGVEAGNSTATGEVTEFTGTVAMSCWQATIFYSHQELKRHRNS